MLKAIQVRPTSYKASNAGIRSKDWFHLPCQLRGSNRYLETYPVNQRTLISMFSSLHQKACHSVKSVEDKWQKSYKRFHKNHFGSNRATANFLNKYTAHRWM